MSNQNQEAKQAKQVEEKVEKSVWETLSSINTNKVVKVLQNGIKYIPWSQAWRLLMEKYPNAREEISEFPEYCWDDTAKRWYATGRTVDYRKTEAGVEVEVSVVIGERRFTCRRPVCAVGGYNRQFNYQPNYNEINTAQMRCLVKAIAMAGLGLNLYYGEDFEENEEESNNSFSQGQNQGYPQQAPQQRGKYARNNNQNGRNNRSGQVQAQTPQERANQLAKDHKAIIQKGYDTKINGPEGEINAVDFLKKAYEEQRLSKENGGDLGIYYPVLEDLCKQNKTYASLFNQLAYALGLVIGNNVNNH